ncbi:MAG: MarR family transcriptional regulator [Peptococcaceae bacterium]|nr:MarR family transcriptional regulator [Peptococcaceae bacterium]
MSEAEDTLKLENQLSFSLYACSKELIRAYKPLLEALNLTYTQYLAMTVLWEFGQTNSKVMGRLLYLDSGTLTPVLKALEQKGYLRRTRGQLDGRHLIVTMTDEGYRLKEKAAHIPADAAAMMGLSDAESAQLAALLNKLLHNLAE